MLLEYFQENLLLKIYIAEKYPEEYTVCLILFPLLQLLLLSDD